jgi:hypothetical protein
METETGGSQTNTQAKQNGPRRESLSGKKCHTERYIIHSGSKLFATTTEKRIAWMGHN